jgi:hypothetical protein
MMKVYLPVRKESDGLHLSNRAFGSRKEAEAAIHIDLRERHNLNRSDYEIHEIGTVLLEARRIAKIVNQRPDAPRQRANNQDRPPRRTRFPSQAATTPPRLQPYRRSPWPEIMRPEQSSPAGRHRNSNRVQPLTDEPPAQRGKRL